MDMAKEDKNDQIRTSETYKKEINSKVIIHLLVDFHDICVVTASLPLVTLFMCFVTAYVFQSEEIHETHCRVYNIIPSISAITGVSPQRYFWRICIALHVGPRIPIAAVYRNYYQNLLANVTNEVDLKRAKFLINLVFWLSVAEIGSLCGVTYVSNRENYPIHEKVFISFMVVSLCHMLASIKLYTILHTTEEITEQQKCSLKWKKILFWISISSTVGLIIFFLKHRLLCEEMAFSWFALCEYIIASANMAFHCTTMMDFPCERFMIAKETSERITKNIFHNNIKEE